MFCLLILALQAEMCVFFWGGEPAPPLEANGVSGGWLKRYGKTTKVMGTEKSENYIIQFP